MKKTMTTIVTGLAVITLLLTVLWYYSDRSIYSIEMKASGQQSYARHYALISAERSELWESIFAEAVETARQKDAYLEWIGEGSQSEISDGEAMQIAIASHVDGIILHQSSSSDMTELIDKAETAGIPVVTVLYDDTESMRTSYVGISGYEMGEFYGSQIAAALQEGDNDILILSDAVLGTEDRNLNLIYSQMVQKVESTRSPAQKVSFATQIINTSTSFDAEEDIRDILMDTDKLPDILICLDLISTECAIQTLVDYNEVGSVALIGYYASGRVLDAISKGVMSATMDIDGKAVGERCIRALDEYYQLGNVSEYFNVSPQLIDQTNVRQYMTTGTVDNRKGENEEVSGDA